MYQTRMHSSKMRTARLLTVSRMQTPLCHVTCDACWEANSPPPAPL